MSEMEVNRFHWADYVVFGISLVISTGIGVYHGWKTTKADSGVMEYMLGNRQLKYVPVAFSILASYMSAIGMLGIPSEVYTFGAMVVLRCFCYVWVFPILAHTFVPFFQKLQLTSAYEYLELRFNKVLKWTGSVTFIIRTYIYMAIALYAPALAMSQASGIPIWASIVIAGIVGTFYTTMGGMRAVVWTDVFQVCVMVAGTLALIIGGTIRVGGLDKVWNINMEGKRLDIFDFRFGLTIRQTFWSTLFGYGLSTMAMHAGSQTTIQRWMSVKNVKEAQITTWLQIPLTSLFQLVLVLQGMVMYAFYHKCDPLQTGRVAKADQLSPLMSIDILGAVPGLPGLFLSAIVCAALSTLSSGINSMSAVVLEDVVKPWYMWKYNTVISDRKATLASKIASGIFGMLAVALAIPAQYVSENVIQFTNRVYSMNSGPVFGLFIVAMFFPWTNSIGAFVGVMTSLVISYWIGLGALIDGPSSPKLPLRIDGCGANNTDVLYTPTAVLEDFVNITMDTPVAETSAGFQIKDLYTLSYLWFTLLGLLVTVIVGLVVSFLSGHNKSGDIPENLLFNWSSCLCWRREKSRHSSEPMSENGYNNNALISTNSSLVKQPLTGKDADLDNITRL